MASNIHKQINLSSGTVISKLDDNVFQITIKKCHSTELRTIKIIFNEDLTQYTKPGIIHVLYFVITESESKNWNNINFFEIKEHENKIRIVKKNTNSKLTTPIKPMTHQMPQNIDNQSITNLNYLKNTEEMKGLLQKNTILENKINDLQTTINDMNSQKPKIEAQINDLQTTINDMNSQKPKIEAQPSIESKMTLLEHRLSFQKEIFESKITLLTKQIETQREILETKIERLLSLETTKPTYFYDQKPTQNTDNNITYSNNQTSFQVRNWDTRGFIKKRFYCSFKNISLINTENIEDQTIHTYEIKGTQHKKTQTITMHTKKIFTQALQITFFIKKEFDHLDHWDISDKENNILFFNLNK